MSLNRVAESEIVMETAESVEAFDWAGEPGGPLFPVYHFCAVALSGLVPEGATVLDLACGPARFLKYFLSGRPDVQGIGVDLSQSMLDVARKALTNAGCIDRVELVQADVGNVDDFVSRRVDAVTCLSALHHAPTEKDLDRLLAAVARMRSRDGAAIWLFDLVRPDNDAIVELIPRSYELGARKSLPPAFNADWISSLRAGWTFDEMSRALKATGLDLQAVTANYSQVHWAEHATGPSPGEALWQGPEPQSSDLDRANKMAQALGWKL